MSDMVAAVRRHLPGARSRAIRAAFLLGWHAGYHDAEGQCVEPCEVWERINR